jgi:hypothetical protein
MQIITKKAAGRNLRILTAILMFVFGMSLHAWAQKYIEEGNGQYITMENYIIGDETMLKVEFKVVYRDDMIYYDKSKVTYPAKNDKYKYNDFCYVRVIPSPEIGENLVHVTPDQIRKAIRNEINKRKAEYDKAGGKEAPGYKDTPVCEMPYILNLDLAYLANIDPNIFTYESAREEYKKLRDSLAINSIVYMPRQDYGAPEPGDGNYADWIELQNEPNFAIKFMEYTPSFYPNSKFYALRPNIHVIGGYPIFATALGDFNIIDKQPFYAEWPITNSIPYRFIYKRLDTYENSNERWTSLVLPFEVDYPFEGIYTDDEGKPMFEAFKMQQDNFMTDMAHGPQGTDYAGGAHFVNMETFVNYVNYKFKYQRSFNKYALYTQQEPMLIRLHDDYQSGEEGVGFIIKSHHESYIHASRGSSFFDMETSQEDDGSGNFIEPDFPAIKENYINYYTDEPYIYMGIRYSFNNYPHEHSDDLYNAYLSFRQYYPEYTPARSEGVRHDMKGTFCGVKHRSIENEGEGNVIYYLAQNKLYSTGNFDKGDQYINAYPFRAWIETRADASAPGKALPLSLSIIADELEGETTGIKELATDDNSTLAIQPGTGTLTFSSKTDRSIAIYDISGRMAANKKIKAGVPQTVSLKPGIYMIEGHKFAVK